MNKSRVHKSTRREGGQPGNRNASKCLPWAESYDLASPDGVHRFLAEIVKHIWTGELGTRQAGALNGTMRLLLEYDMLPELRRRIDSLEANRGKSN